MQYIKRTLQVRSALIQRANLLEEIRTIFRDAIAGDQKSLRNKWVGSGTSRDAYEVGVCDIEDTGRVVLLLKVYKQGNERGRTWEGACGRPYPQLGNGSAEEFGAFEVYYDFAAGHIPHISFASKRRLNQFNKSLPHSYYQLKQEGVDIPLDSWDGLSVAVGDLGALPYFQMAVKWGKYFGWLTEGEPPIIDPKGTAREHGLDERNVEQGRIIDLSAHHCTLRRINKERPLGKEHRDWLGLIKRGKKYLLPENRLDV